MTDDGGQKTVDKRRMREDRRNQWGTTGMLDFDSDRALYSSAVSFEPLPRPNMPRCGDGKQNLKSQIPNL
jgi:hypothetical protein